MRNERRFSENRARFYFAEIYLAITYLHSQNIIYRDLKPENVLLDMKGHVWLTDFGISSMSLTAQSFCGTPEYLAPEILHSSSYDHAIDLWSLGILLYEMLTGGPPFEGNTRESIF